MGSFKNRVGEKIGNLTVIERDEDFFSKGGSRRTMWKCKCDCGNVISVRADSLNGKHTLSCGCLQRKIASNNGKKIGSMKSQEGLSREPLHNIWYLMLYRCNNPKSKAFHNYGGRGIKVCKEWDDGTKTLDRINNNDDYSPQNCRWASAKEQNGNKRNNLRITLNEKTHIASDWDRMMGFPMGTISRRINAGWDSEKAITTPIRLINKG